MRKEKSVKPPNRFRAIAVILQLSMFINLLPAQSMRNKDRFLVIFFLFFSSAVFAQKAELIKEFKLKETLLKEYEINFKCFDSIYAENDFYGYSSSIFIDNEEIGIHIYDKNVYIFFYNYVKDCWREPVILNPGDDYKDSFIKILNKDYCVFNAINTKTNIYEDFQLVFSDEKYITITKEEIDKEWELYKQNQKRISFYQIIDDQIKSEAYDIRFSGHVTKCAIGNKEKFGSVYEYAKLNNNMQLLKTKEGKDFLWDDEINPVCNSDCTRVLCISNISYKRYEFFDDDYRIYIYDISY